MINDLQTRFTIRYNITDENDVTTMYKFELPIAPSEITINFASNNETVNILNFGEVTRLKSPSPLVITISSFFTRIQRYKPTNSYPLEYYINVLRTMQERRKFIEFEYSDAVRSNYLYIPCTVENLDVSPTVGNVDETDYTLTLKQYRPIKAVVTLRDPEIVDPTADTSTNENERTSIIKEPFIGCNVLFTGTLHRQADGSGAGQKRVDYRGKINYIKTGAKCPYHLTTPQGGHLGWILSNSIQVID